MPTTARDLLPALLLEALDARPGHTVLEVGAGPQGRTAALCDLVGAGGVVTVEADEATVRAAHSACWNRGHNPLVICGDGLGRYPRSPFDRVVTSRPVGRVPAAWVEQTRPGGLIVAPLGAGLWRLQVEDNQTASGQMVAPIASVQVQAAKLLPEAVVVALTEAGGGQVYAGHLVRAYRQDTLTALAALALPDVQRTAVRGDHPFTIWVDPATRSWVRLDAKLLTTYGGPRELLGQLDLLNNWWALAGQPAADRWGLTVGVDGTHTLWVDQPGQHELPLPAL